MKRSIVFWGILALTVPFLFLGCSGDEGAAGPPGPQGEAGEGGLPGPITNTNESCAVCHGPDRIVEITDVEPLGTHYFAELHNLPLTVTITNISNVGGNPVVDFTVTTGTPPVPVTNLDNTNVRFMIADLVPAGTPTSLGTFSTDQFDRWAYERQSSGYQFGTFDNNNLNGTYTYTFATTFGDSTPDNVVPSAYNAAHSQRFYVRIGRTGYNNGAGFADIASVPAAGNAATILTFLNRQFVTIDACRHCHGPLLANTAHGSGYVDTNACILCHSPINSVNDDNVALGQVMQDTEAWLASLIHKVHAAIPMPAFPNRLNGQGYGAMTYPQDVRRCVTCHTNSGLNLGAGDLTNNWRAHPTAAACKTCHQGFPLTSNNANPVHALNGGVHPGGTNQPDSSCSTCHPADGPIGAGASVTFAHDTSPEAVLHPNPKNIPEFNVTLTLTPPANGTHYVAGDNVLATVTLRNHSDNTAVDNALYTAPQGAAGNTSDNALRVASIYFYGPRAFPKPLTGTQANSLFVNASANVLTDATGLKYRLTVPSGLAAGTYMVRVRIGDYGRVGTGNYVVESIAFQTVQIGQAAATLKVAGDACTYCHGPGSAPFHDERHIVVWDTDECIACHDYSGGHAATLSNRVHAVHAGNTYGDMSNPLGFTTPSREWDHVFYPADKRQVGAIYRPSRCTTCHDSGNTSYRGSTIHEVACLGCHGDPAPGTATTPGPAISHMLQMGGDYPALVAP